MFKSKGNDIPVVKIGDDNTMLRINGYGYMDYKIMGKGVRLMGYYVPNLGTSLISVRQPIQYNGCYYHGENNEYVLPFPSFISTAIIGYRIILLISPSKNSPDSIDFDEQIAELCKSLKSIFTVVNPAIAKMASIKKIKPPKSSLSNSFQTRTSHDNPHLARQDLT